MKNKAVDAPPCFMAENKCKNEMYRHYKNRYFLGYISLPSVKKEENIFGPVYVSFSTREFYDAALVYIFTTLSRNFDPKKKGKKAGYNNVSW